MNPGESLQITEESLYLANMSRYGPKPLRIGLFKGVLALYRPILAKTTQILYWDTNLTEEPDHPSRPILQSNRCPSTGYGPKPPVYPLFSPCTAPVPANTGQNHPKTTQILYWDADLTEGSDPPNDPLGVQNGPKGVISSVK